MKEILSHFAIQNEVGEPPIYKYTREGYEGLQSVSGEPNGTVKFFRDGQLYILRGDKICKVLYLPVYFVMFMQAKQAEDMDESELIF